MNISYFKTEVAPKLIKYSLTYSSYPEGDFGSLERVELSGRKIIATLDFWSQGWLDMSVYDYQKDEVVINEFFKPETSSKHKEALLSLCEVLIDNG